jgi:DNA polymerase III sliding clamp (beta) subunit (PCNA family)
MRVEIRADVFYRAVKSTAFAASRDFDFKRPAFSGVLLDVTPKKFRVVATDGYRLALFESDDGHDCREPMTAILSARELTDLKLPRTSGVIIKIAVNDAEAVIQHEKAGFSVPVIQAQYPHYFGVFPPVQGSITMRCEKAEFLKALMDARLETTRQNRNVFFWTRPGCVAFAAQDKTILSPVRIAAQCDYSVSAVVNANFLRDAVQVLPPGSVQIRLAMPDAERPVRDAMELSSVDQLGNVIRQLVMPCWLPFIPPLPGFDS